ncbi:hypothetical protein ACEV73_23635, partial [Vibrio parahaemolyticus]
FETKLGERVQVVQNPQQLEASLQVSTAQFVLLGIPEDVGVKANGGIGGADSAWLPFLKAFLNIQSNDFLEGSDILLLGHFDFSAIEQLIEQHAHDGEEKMEAFRHAVNTVDDAVEQLIHTITQFGKI